jgi:hypothetical protein
MPLLYNSPNVSFVPQLGSFRPFPDPGLVGGRWGEAGLAFRRVRT